jgi:hypothetical protein
MSIPKKYDLPEIDNVLSRYETSPVNSGNGAGIFFRWQLLVGGSPFDSSKISNYLASTAGSFKVDGDGRHTLDFNLKNLLGSNKYNPGSYALRLYTHVTPHNETSTRALEFYVKAISSKKDEIILGVHDHLTLDGNTSEVRYQSSTYQSALTSFVSNILPLDNLVLSLADGSVVNIISNKLVSGTGYKTFELAVKLSKGIAKNIKPGQRAKIEIQITEPREWDIIIPQPPYVEDLNIMALPDFTINSATSQGPLSSKYETWTSLLGSNEDVKNKLLNATFSGSNATSAELGIDYRKYENFVHFSSAKERLDNFKYKIQLIEYYDSQSVALSASASPAAEVNRVQFVTKKNDIISKFDAYEDYLYTESSSYENGSYGIFNASTWPKTNSSIPYTLAHSTSSAFKEWYATQSATALDYDIDNAYNLEKTIPAHVRLDPENANYLMFVNMIGQNFDHVYNYIDHMDMIHDRQNELHLGLSKDLVWDVLKSLGWHGINGYNFEDLWAYKLGTDESGSYQATDSGSTQTYVNASSMPTEDITKEVWSRTLNNLPHLISTKGTERSVRALVNTYGLPPTVLRIKEYGGTPKEMSTNQYIKYENSGYSLNFDGNQCIKTPWSKLDADDYTHIPTDKAPDTIELRFNTSTPQNSLLIHYADYWGIELEAHPSASNESSAYHNHGRLWLGVESGSGGTWTATSSAYHPLFDNDWWNIQFGISGQVFSLDLKKSADHSNGRITHEEKIAWTHDGRSDTNIWNRTASPHSLALGNHHPSFGATYKWTMASGSTVAAGTLGGYTGSMQELRYWASPSNPRLSDAAFDNHVLSPLSIEGNTYTSSYTDLVARWPMGATGVTASLNSVTLPSKHPNQNISTASFDHATPTMILSGSGYTGTSADWQYEEETFYTVVPEIIGTRAVSDKIRIVDSTYSGSLYRNSSVVSSSTELSAPDSPLLGVFFSPNDDIDLDISHTIGGAKFDDFVGNPRDAYRTSYKELGHIRNHYWQKYLAAPSFTAYLKVLKYFDTSLFLQLESLLPARANKQTGLLIKPNLLERPTIARVSESFADLTYEQVEGVDITLYSFSTWTPEPLITATAKTYIINGRDTKASATTNLPNSFDDSLATSYGISNIASVDVPIYDRSTVSKRYRTQATDGTDTSVSVQEFVPAGIANQRYAGSKYGKVGGSIGGIINLINDPSVTGKGLFDASTNIKCAIEVVETNPIELTTTQGPLTALGDIQIR